MFPAVPPAVPIDPRTVAEIGGALTVFGLAAARHMPAPREGSVVYAWMFDTIQDLAKNNDRIGARRKVVSPPALPSPHPSPAAVNYTFGDDAAPVQQ